MLNEGPHKTRVALHRRPVEGLRYERLGQDYGSPHFRHFSDYFFTVGGRGIRLVHRRKIVYSCGGARTLGAAAGAFTHRRKGRRRLASLARAACQPVEKCAGAQHQYADCEVGFNQAGEYPSLGHWSLKKSLPIIHFRGGMRGRVELHAMKSRTQRPIR